MASTSDRNGSAVFALCLGVGIFLQGCGGEKIDQVNSGGGCVAEAGAGSVGRCPKDVSACQVGFVDLDGASANGCEMPLQASGANLLFKVANGGIAQLVINDFALNADIIGGWVAINGDPCTAKMTLPCTYGLVALQLQVADFTFDGMSFSEGFFALPRPLLVTDKGDGLVVPAGSGIIASFLVSGKKHVVSAGIAEGGLAVQLTDDRKSATITGHGLHVSFGGCTMSTTVAASAAPPS